MPYVIHEHSRYTSAIDKYWYFLKLEKAHEFYAEMLSYRDIEFPAEERLRHCRNHFEEDGEPWEYLELDEFSFEDEDEDTNEKDNHIPQHNETHDVEEEGVCETAGGDSTEETGSVQHTVPMGTTHSASLHECLSRKAGLLFPVGRVARSLKTGQYAARIAQGTPVYLAATLEYLCAEILELSGRVAEKKGATRILPSHILTAIHEDDELHKVFADICTVVGEQASTEEVDEEGERMEEESDMNSEDESELINIRNDDVENQLKQQEMSLVDQVWCAYHPQHVLVKGESCRFHCDVCGCGGDEYSYYCIECDFDAHLKCVHMSLPALPECSDNEL